LVTSAVAAFRKEMDISVGNIIGSNIFNIFAVLGMTSMVKGISINELTRSYDILWMLGITILLFVFMLPPSRAKLKRWKGIIMLSVYGFYIYKLFTM
jgi:cation:H+ antiporter